MPEITESNSPPIRQVEILCYLAVWLGALSLLLIPETSGQLVIAFSLFIAPTFFLSIPPRTTSVYRTTWHVITLVFIL